MADVIQRAPLRPAATLMSPARAAAALPNAQSFPRSAMRELVRGRYRVEKLRFDLDAEGRGEILYRLVGGGRAFHFFLISQKLPEAQKTDRNFAQSWDAMGVLCEGEWNAEREARLRGEVPKQRAGYADYDTLIYARGNRSARVFDHVVDSLAEGRQPVLALIAPIGYILRTTAFIGNGALGTRPWAGFGPDHPMRRPYHAQFCSAFVLREYVFDLVDHLARARSERAVRLAPAYRRYLGLGNSAATGLAAFVANHPHFMHRWSLACEEALAEAKARPLPAGFGPLLDKAIRYHIEGERPSDGVFATPQALAADLDRVREAHARIDATQPAATLCEWTGQHVSTEACEIVNSIVVELHPDIVERHADDFEADERFEVAPEMTAGELRRRLRSDYGWALRMPASQRASQYFWYRSTAAPRDVRRGVRGRGDALEAETAMDTVLQVQRLEAYLANVEDHVVVADVARARPELRHVVARVQSLAGCDFAELRQQMLAGDYSPFATIRYPLSFFGMEKFEAAPPKSVRGTFMQGAPIAEDVALGRDGSWPFPLLPGPATELEMPLLAPLPDAPTWYRAPSSAATQPAGVLRIAPNELARMVQTSLQGHGAALGVAEDAAPLVAFAQACGDPAVATHLRHCAEGSRSALLEAPSAFDAAIARAHASGAGAVVVIDIDDGWLARELVVRAARRGFVGALLWQASAKDAGFSMAGPGEEGPWIAWGSTSAAASLVTEALHAAGADGLARPVVDASLFFACVRPHGSDLAEGVLASVAREAPDATMWRSAEFRQRRDAWPRRGIELACAEFDALAAAGRTLLVPQDAEHRILHEGADPLKSF